MSINNNKLPKTTSLYFKSLLDIMDELDDDYFNNDNIIINSYGDNIKNNIELLKKNIVDKNSYYNYKNPHITCICCRNYVVLHEKNIKDFLEYSNTKKNKKSLSLVYRLCPDTVIKYPNYYNSIKNCIPNINYSYETYCFQFEIYFYKNNFNNKIDIIEDCNNFLSCTICKNNLCEQHYKMNKYFTKKCDYCIKYWNICSWCKFDSMTFFYNNTSTRLLYEESLCNNFHKN